MKCFQAFRVALSLGLGLFLSTSSVFAAEQVDLQHFHPSSNGYGLFGLESARTLQAFQPYFGLSFNYGQAPLSVQYEDGTSDDLVSNQIVSHVQLGVGLFSRMDVALGFPVVLMQDGVELATGDKVSSQTIGDIRITPRFRFLGGEDKYLSASLVVPFTIPVGDELDYAGEAGLTFNPQLALAGKPGRIFWNMNLGYRIRPAVELSYQGMPLTLGNEITYGLAMGLRFAEYFQGGIEFEGAVGQDGDMSNTVDDPAEIRAGIKLCTSYGLRAILGAGFGLTGGYGVPVFRAFGGLGYEIGGGKPRLKDRDRDGIADETDTCPNSAEDRDGFQDEDGCPDPDNDADGFLDTEDICPTEPEVINGLDDTDGCPDTAPDMDGDTIPDSMDKCPEKREDLDGFQDDDGCYDPDNDADGVLDLFDGCKEEPEDVDGFADEDGCPDPDNDNDGIPDAMDKCPIKPEIINNIDDEDGCPEPDRDHDGIVDVLDKCLKKAETVNGFQDDDGCPERDRDKDGVVDALDKCINKKEVVNGYKDDDGCPDGDRDKDGIFDDVDKCPRKAEIVNGIVDDDGCPETDTDGDGIIDQLDKCPKEKEKKNGFEDDDGCPDAVPTVPPVPPVPPAPETKKEGAPVFKVESKPTREDVDGDGLLNELDKCPDKAEIRNGFEDDDGCPEPDSDGDGIVDGLDKCVDASETINGFMDDDGCPETDGDGDGIIDDLDKCPTEAENVNGTEDADGCPDGDPSEEMLDLLKKKADLDRGEE